MARLQLLLQTALDYMADLIRRKPVTSLHQNLTSAQKLLIIFPPGALAEQHEKEIKQLLALFSDKEIAVIYHHPGLKSGGHFLNLPFPSVHLNSLDFWPALTTPSLNVLNHQKWDLLINLDPQPRLIYRCIQRRIHVRYAIALSTDAAKADKYASFVFNSKTDQPFGKSILNLKEILQSAGQDQ